MLYNYFNEVYFIFPIIYDVFLSAFCFLTGTLAPNKKLKVMWCQTGVWTTHSSSRTELSKLVQGINGQGFFKAPRNPTGRRREKSNLAGREKPANSTTLQLGKSLQCTIQNTNKVLHARNTSSLNTINGLRVF